ncbi:MAG: flotillin family protein [Erysipelotrichaceae bacterium]|nr:flotillin family protein [Erysipelotrichaceae bacterium]MBQ1300486.1 flotillin family protein [Erysipelotrichaceae bacterium]MBQ1315325.1 flotillin family protein [Erysipelotrichaceae bacterium]MBQ2214524.1 flotillin family protein [Erysipelotrichaceae bacterium]MBR2791282.1 flotillin family protein [Erysipelotrichaceae bacterium]
MEKLIPYIVPALIIIVVMVIVLTGYVKASPDVAIIISGLKKTPRVLIGRAGIKIPFLEKVDHLHLGQISVDIKTDSYIPTNDFINVKVDAIAKVRIDTSPEGMLKAERNFLNKEPQEIAYELQDSLQGNMREIIGTLDLKTINTDRDSFSDQVMAKASKDMEKLGIEILSCNIQNVTDENGLINDLGMDNTSKIKKDAQIARAEADRDVAIAKAEADRAANDARVAAETEIAKKNNELAIKQAELKLESDRKQAMADAAYEIQKQEQQKSIQTATVNAQIARAEREAELKQKEVEIRQQELAATVEKQADADKYAVQQSAEANMIKLKREAEAKKYLAQMEAEAIEAKGKAEAEAIRLKGIAEAEAMEKKAEAYQKYNGAAMAEMMISIMPQLAAEIAKPISAIDKVTIYGGGNGDGSVSQVSGNMPVIMKQVFDTMSEATGVDLREILRANTYDAKVNKNINVTGLDNVEEK